MVIIGGVLKLAAGLAVAALGALLLYAGAGVVGGILGTAVLAIAINVMDYKVLAASLGLSTSTLEQLFLMIFAGSVILSCMGLSFIGNILGGAGTILFGLLLTGIFSGEFISGAIGLLSGISLAGIMPFAIVIILIVLFFMFI